MPTPKLLSSTRRRVPLATAAPGGSAPPPSHTLTITVARQLQSQWCWAAVSSSVSQYYNPSATWTQCKVAKDELGKACCNTPLPSGCNVPWYLDLALTRVGHFKPVTSPPSPFSTVQTETFAGRPVCCRIGWSGGGGHFVAIQGYSQKVIGGGPVDWLEIEDPFYGHSSLSFSTFSTAYQGSGSWTDTYFTH